MKYNTHREKYTNPEYEIVTFSQTERTCITSTQIEKLKINTTPEATEVFKEHNNKIRVCAFEINRDRKRLEPLAGVQEEKMWI